MKDSWDPINDPEDDRQEIPQKHGEESFFKNVIYEGKETQWTKPGDLMDK